MTFANGTAALHGAVWAAGVGPDDVVATSALTFTASASCARFLGASLRFLDIDPDTLLINPAAIPPCTCLVAVHFAGLPVDLRLVRPRPRIVIEDAAHALGALTPDGPVGNCANSDMTVFSFHPVKSVTTGEGGAVTTNSDSFAARLRQFRNHGMIPKPEHGGWYYEVNEIGFNYRLSDIHAALGRSQLMKLDRWIARRNELAAQYRTLLADLPLRLPAPAEEGFRHAYHLFPVQVADRDRVFEQLRALDIGVQVHYIPLYRHPAYRVFGTPDKFPGAERAYAGLLSLPLFPSLADREQAVIVGALRRLLLGAPTSEGIG